MREFISVLPRPKSVNDGESGGRPWRSMGRAERWQNPRNLGRDGATLSLSPRRPTSPQPRIPRTPIVYYPTTVYHSQHYRSTFGALS